MKGIKEIERMARRARQTSVQLATLTSETKNRLLDQMARLLMDDRESILRENERDLKEAEKKRLSPALVDRLTLSGRRIEEMALGLQAVRALPDPVGEIVASWERPNGLKIEKVRIPLGVIAIIYESRPNVTVDAASLCLKAGNAVILRGGSEAIHSNQALAKILCRGLQAAAISPHALQLVKTPDRTAMSSLVRQAGLIDLVIPRGGEGLMRWIETHSKVPVIKHDKGICHVFVDESADLSMAEKIVLNAKVQRPGVCNAMETLLVHKKVAPQFLPRMVPLLREAGVEVRGDPATRRLAAEVKRAEERDWATEYLDLILSVRVVPDLETALNHIQKYGSHHTESIVTEDREAAETFLHRLDSSVVLWNASTRFNDGGQLGLGSEIGISTTKLHAFGPMGLKELTTTKFVVRGTGQIRES